jgi:hypothetical protein
MKKPSQTEKIKPKRFEPVFILKNQIKTDRFKLILVFFLKRFQFNYFFK